MFRNVRYYRLDADWPASEEALSQRLEAAAFEPCGPLTERSSGWVPVCPDAGDSLARRLNGADLLRLRSQSRVLPAAAINEELELRINAYRKRMQEDPSPRQKRRLRAETRDELLPRAMLKSDRIFGYIDLKEKIIGVDSAQETAADRFLRRLRTAFGDLPVRPLQFNQPVGEFLSKVFLGDAPRQFALGRECRMQDASDPGSIVRWNDFDLDDSSIREHVINGMQLTELAIVYDTVLGCVLDRNGIIRKLRFLGTDEDDDNDDPQARFDAEFTLLTGTLRRLLADLKQALDGIV